LAVSAPASEVQKKFGTYHDHAMTEPVRVTKYGRETVYIVSAKTLGKARFASKDLTDAEASLIEAAEIPDDKR
jgi:antitoxin StbD